MVQASASRNWDSPDPNFSNISWIAQEAIRLWR